MLSKQFRRKLIYLYFPIFAKWEREVRFRDRVLQVQFEFGLSKVHKRPFKSPGCKSAEFSLILCRSVECVRVVKFKKNFLICSIETKLFKVKIKLSRV